MEYQTFPICQLAVHTSICGIKEMRRLPGRRWKLCDYSTISLFGKERRIYRISFKDGHKKWLEIIRLHWFQNPLDEAYNFTLLLVAIIFEWFDDQELNQSHWKYNYRKWWLDKAQNSSPASTSKKWWKKENYLRGR
jgi:hypothetical protein